MTARELAVQLNNLPEDQKNLPIYYRTHNDHGYEITSLYIQYSSRWDSDLKLKKGSFLEVE